MKNSASNSFGGKQRIDAHHHFWKYDPREYGWISSEMAAIQRDFLPEDLKHEIDAAGVQGVVSVQARQSLQETQWLLELAGQYGFIRGVVGWVPLVDPGLEDVLARLCSHHKLKGVRHVVQDEPDEMFLLREDFNRGVHLLRRFGLAYDILIFERHLPQAIQFVDRHPDQVFVLDHIAKPRIRDGLMEPWASRIRELARRPNVYCKVSGMVTEADWHNWQPDQLRPYFDIVLEAFGPERLMFGTDWPVCLLACSYRRWVELVEEFVAGLSPSEQAAIWSRTAQKVYRLGELA